MKEKIIHRVKELLGSGEIQGFLGLKAENGHVSPHLFTDPEELDLMSLGDFKKAGDARFPLNKILTCLAKSYPDSKLAVLARGCDERGLIELFKWKQLEAEKVLTIGLACPQELAKECGCSKPWPDECTTGEKADGVPENETVKKLEALPLQERFGFWMEQFDKCVKCYGCRNVCPMCFCNECSLEEPDLIETAKLPTENPIFHLTRAIHMVGRCIDCGLCEEACPADIPLRTLYKKVGEIIESDTGYRTGVNRDDKCPFNTYGDS
jgi:ferredoxin